METVVKIFKALSDETRLKILMIISSKVMCQRGISKCLQISDSAVSQHIKILKDADIITRYKEGYYVFYKINKDIFMIYNLNILKQWFLNLLKKQKRKYLRRSI